MLILEARKLHGAVLSHCSVHIGGFCLAGRCGSGARSRRAQGERPRRSPVHSMVRNEGYINAAVLTYVSIVRRCTRSAIAVSVCFGGDVSVPTDEFSECVEM